MAQVTHCTPLMSNHQDPTSESISFDESIRQLERHPPYSRHIQDVADRALRLLDAMERCGFAHEEISDYFKARVLVIGDSEAREVVAGCCARAMTIRYGPGGGKDRVRKSVDEARPAR